MSVDALYDYIGGLDWPTAKLIEDLFIIAAKYPFDLKQRTQTKQHEDAPDLRQWLDEHHQYFDFASTCRRRGTLLMTRLDATQRHNRDHPKSIINAQGYPPRSLWVSHQPEWLLSWIPKRAIPNVQKTLELNHEGPCSWAHTFTPDYQLNQTHSNPPWHHLPKTHLTLTKDERVIRVAPCSIKAFTDVWKYHAPLD